MNDQPSTPEGGGVRRKKRQAPQNVRFTVSWIEGEIVLPHIKDMPMTVAQSATRNDVGPLMTWLPDEIAQLVEDATIRENEEFFTAWNTAGEEVDALAKHANSFTKWLRGLS